MSGLSWIIVDSGLSWITTLSWTSALSLSWIAGLSWIIVNYCGLWCISGLSWLSSLSWIGGLPCISGPSWIIFDCRGSSSMSGLSLINRSSCTRSCLLTNRVQVVGLDSCTPLPSLRGQVKHRVLDDLLSWTTCSPPTPPSLCGLLRACHASTDWLAPCLLPLNVSPDPASLALPTLARHSKPTVLPGCLSLHPRTVICTRSIKRQHSIPLVYNGWMD